MMSVTITRVIRIKVIILALMISLLKSIVLGYFIFSVEIVINKDKF